MTAITMPKAPELSELVPLNFSTDGTKNSFCMRCDAQGQTMSYAACLWRQGVISKPDIRTPADWAPCGDAARQGRCVAVAMRAEEEAAERSIYFRKRVNEAHPMVEAKRSWVNTWDKVRTVATSAVTTIARAVTPAPKAPADILDSIGSTSYADALTRAVAEDRAADTAKLPATTTPAASAAPTPAASAAPTPAASAPITALPGESPLAMARRIAALRAGQAAKQD